MGLQESSMFTESVHRNFAAFVCALNKAEKLCSVTSLKHQVPMFNVKGVITSIDKPTENYHKQ